MTSNNSAELEAARLKQSEEVHALTLDLNDELPGEKGAPKSVSSANPLSEGEVPSKATTQAEDDLLVVDALKDSEKEVNPVDAPQEQKELGDLTGLELDPTPESAQTNSGFVSLLNGNPDKDAKKEKTESAKDSEIPEAVAEKYEGAEDLSEARDLDENILRTSPKESKRLRISKWALHKAARFAPPETLKRLLKLGADINRGNNRNETPLMISVRNKREDNVHFLLSQGADTSIKGPRGETAADMARKIGHKEIIRLLEEGPKRRGTLDPEKVYSPESSAAQAQFKEGTKDEAQVTPPPPMPDSVVAPASTGAIENTASTDEVKAPTDESAPAAMDTSLETLFRENVDATTAATPEPKKPETAAEKKEPEAFQELNLTPVPTPTESPAVPETSGNSAPIPVTGVPQAPPAQALP